MPDERTYGFNRDDAGALLQSISNGETWYPEIKPRGGSSRRPAVLAEDLTAPASSLVAATSVYIYFLELQADGTQELSDSPAELAYNDDPQLTGDLGTYCRVELLNHRWMFYYLSCTAQEALVEALEARELEDGPPGGD